MVGANSLNVKLLSQFRQTFLTNPSELRIYLNICKIPTHVIVETLIYRVNQALKRFKCMCLEYGDSKPKCGIAFWKYTFLSLLYACHSFSHIRQKEKYRRQNC